MKKTIVKIVALLLAVCLASSAFIPAVAEEPDILFSDVAAGKWYEKAVKYVAEKGLMTGTADGVFSPGVKFTRAMTVQVLSRLSGDDLSGYSSTDFTDVPAGKWYTSAVAWAAENGIAAGNGASFDPTGSVTREQLALMVCRFAKKYLIVNKFAAGSESADSFKDADKIHSWAKEGVEWAIYNGSIAGNGDGTLNPAGTATRAQAAQIFYNLHYMKEHHLLPPDTSAADALSIKESDKPRILCWGDSLTSGGFPAPLRDMLGIPVRDFGISGETAESIGMRQGGIPFYVAPVTIPAKRQAVEVHLYDENYEEIFGLARAGTSGLAPLIIAGVTGHVAYNDELDTYFFTRLKDGEEASTDRLTRVITQGILMRQSSDIHVLFLGANNYYDSDEAYKLIELQSRLIDYLGSDRFIVISQTSLYFMPGLRNFNEDLAAEYGDRFVDIHKYFITDALRDANIEPTEQDLIDMEMGETPSSLRVDVDHGNSIYARLLAEKIASRIKALGYIN